MENKSPHILATASNLLGFSFVVLTSIKSLGLPKTTFIDEIVSALIIVLALSCFFSFSSIRSKDEKLSQRHETIADYLFLTSLTLISVTSVFAGLDYLIFSH